MRQGRSWRATGCVCDYVFPGPATTAAFVPWSAAVAAAAAAVTAAATAVETARRRNDLSRTTLRRGRLVSGAAPNRRLNVLYYDAPGKTAPCVVLEAGANSWSPVWASVAHRLRNNARVLSYDRAGFGLSDVDLSPSRSVHSVAADLMAAIRNIGADPPYILVAHSLGALFVNAAIDLLPTEDVLGVVYVDAASPDSVREIEGVVPRSSPPPWLARLLGSVGLLRVVAPRMLATYYDVFSARLRREALATWARGDWLLAYTREWTAALQYAGIRLPPSRSSRRCWKRETSKENNSCNSYRPIPQYQRSGGILQRLFPPSRKKGFLRDDTLPGTESGLVSGESIIPVQRSSEAKSKDHVQIDSIEALERHLHHQHEQEVSSASAPAARKRFGPGWLGNMPISVIVPDLYDRIPGKRYVGQIQRRVVQYSSDVEYFEPKNCGHFVQLDQPDCVVEAIWSVARRAQNREETD